MVKKERPVIRYQDHMRNISAASLRGFFVDWPDPPSPATHLKLLGSSALRVLAVDAGTGNVVGFVTAITDGVLCAYIPFLEVLPLYQGRGIGKELVDRMMRKLRKAYMIDLVCDAGLHRFYKKFNMRPSHAMIRRNYPNQSGKKIC